VARGSSGAERVEWALGLLCGLAVLALAGFLLREGLRSGATPPVLSVAIEPAPSGEVRFTVRNDGGRTATALALSLRLGDGAERRLVIDYLPGHSEASGGFVLPAGMAPEAAQLVVEGYVDP
jgi:uncharacterized protein (TIGR02588 family)